MTDKPTWAELEARRVELEAEQERLVAEVKAMHPNLGARALRVLADKFELLEEDYRQLLERQPDRQGDES